MSSLPKGKSLVAVRALERLLTRVNPLVLPDIDNVKPKNNFFSGSASGLWEVSLFLKSHPSRTWPSPSKKQYSDSIGVRIRMGNSDPDPISQK
jgi:hypothetical protein